MDRVNWNLGAVSSSPSAHFPSIHGVSNFFQRFLSPFSVQMDFQLSSLFVVRSACAIQDIIVDALEKVDFPLYLL